MDKDLAMRLTSDPQSPALARRAITQFLSDHGIDGITQDAAILVVSELVTNAMEHGAEPIELRAALVGDVIRVEVSDDGRRRVTRRMQEEPWSTTGRGLAIVEAVTLDWGVVRHGAVRKGVWATLGALRT